MTVSAPAAVLRLRATANRWFPWALTAHVPILALIGWLNGTGGWGHELAALLLAGAALAASRLDRTGEATSYMVAVSYVAVVSLMVAKAAGPWQIDLHMYYFAAFAILAVYCDWRVILLAAGVTAVHHLTLNFVLPYAVFPGGADFGRVVVHAVIVVVECGVLIALTHKLVGAFAGAEQALARADSAAEEARTLSEARDAAERRAQAERKAELARVADAFGARMATLMATADNSMRTLGEAAAKLGRQVVDSGAQATDVSATVQQAVTGVESAAAAAEELAATIREVSAQVTESARIAGEAASETRATSRTVDSLNEAALRIGQVVELISQIAGQTNLLALNATIEAARAGEAGKGFAVVAGEVKSLANQTARATEDITRQVQAIQSVAGEAARAMGGVAGIMDRLTEIATGVAAAVEQQQAATQEIARNVAEVSTGAGSAATALARVASQARDTGRDADGLRRVVDGVAGDVGQLRTALDGFVAQLRAG